MGGTNVYKHLLLEGRCFMVPARDDDGSDVTSGLLCLGTMTAGGSSFFVVGAVLCFTGH